MPAGKETLTDDLRVCPRCGEEHKALIFAKFTRPAFMGGVAYTYWAQCPHTKEPLFFEPAMPQPPVSR